VTVVRERLALLRDYLNTLASSSQQANSIEALVRDVLSRFEYVLLGYVFGSLAGGRASASSDIDVAIYASRQLGWRDLAAVVNALEKALGRRADVVVLNEAPLALAYQIVAHGIPVLVKDQNLRVEVETRIVREWLDFKPRLDKYYAAVLHSFKPQKQRDRSAS